MLVLIGYATRHGSTRGIAERIAARLTQRGCHVKVRPAEQVRDLCGYDAVVLGSAVEAGSWRPEATQFAERRQDVLATLPVWLFSVGLKDTQRGLLGKVFDLQGEVHDVERIRAAIHPRGYRRFTGAVKRGDYSGLRRLIFDGLGGQYGDFRDWATVDAWTEEIARELKTAVGAPVRA